MPPRPLNMLPFLRPGVQPVMSEPAHNMEAMDWMLRTVDRNRAAPEPLTREEFRQNKPAQTYTPLRKMWEDTIRGVTPPALTPPTRPTPKAQKSGAVSNPNSILQGLGPERVMNAGGGLPDWIQAYGASPVTGMGGGVPLSGTMEKALINMQQAKLLQKALKGK